MFNLQHNETGDGERETKERAETERESDLFRHAEQYREQTCQDGADPVTVSRVCTGHWTVDTPR